MARGNFPFNFGDDFYPSRSGFEDPNQRPMKPYCRPYSLTPSQVQYGGGVRRVRRCLAALAPLQAQVLANKPVRQSVHLIHTTKSNAI